jgi:uncharacterized heparinase superfamily protein
MYKVLRWYYTIKYLKPIQILGRLIFYLPRWIKPVAYAPEISVQKSYLPFILKKGITSDFNAFTFLNESYLLDQIGWDNPDISKLWRYNLHYFNYINHDPKGIYIIEKWIDENPFGIGTGWEPYPTSQRIINWIKWHWSTNGLSEKAIISLWNQLRWLEGRPEYHLLGNHLLLNAKALLFASVFFDLKNHRIKKKGEKIFFKEIEEQFLDDGAHFELSPMYHSLALEDLMDVYNILPSEKLQKKIEKGLNWLNTMICGNGELPHFNDCANGIAPSFDSLLDYALDLKISYNKIEEARIHHSSSGFVVFKNSLSHLIADVGHIGPDYLPGHAHADTLSFELEIKGIRTIVNSGTSTYGISPERLKQRSTIAHSTVEIDGMNSSEVWSGFRVARRARTFNKHSENLNQGEFGASHDGYKNLKNSPIHSRFWKYQNNFWIITDKVTGLRNKVISRYYFHPEVELVETDGGYILKQGGTNFARVNIIQAGYFELLNTTYHDEFGVSKPNKCIAIYNESPCDLEIRIEIL